jgi:hypothetical protein
VETLKRALKTANRTSIELIGYNQELQREVKKLGQAVEDLQELLELLHKPESV